jgi:hypothetical protein
MKAFEYFIKAALEQGCTVSVVSDGIVDLSKSRQAAEIIEAVEAVDWATLIFYNQENKRLGWAQAGAYGLADDETIIDYGVNDFMESINQAYTELCNEKN